MQKLTFKDFEFEFLKTFGIEYVNGHFVDVKTGEEFEYWSSQETRDKFDYNTLEYVFVGPKCEIEFFRQTHAIYGDGYQVSVSDYKYKYFALQDYFEDHDVIRTRIVGIDSYRHHELSKSNSRKHMHDPKYDKDYYSHIHVESLDSSDYISKINYEENRDTKNPTICSLSSIYQNADYYKPMYGFSVPGIEIKMEDILSYDNKIALNIENYRQALINDINRIYAKNSRARKFYLQTVDFLVEAFATHLRYHANYQAYYEKRLAERKLAIEQNYEGEVKKQKLLEISEMANYLYNYYPNLEIAKKDSNSNGDSKKKA